MVQAWAAVFFNSASIFCEDLSEFTSSNITNAVAKPLAALCAAESNDLKHIKKQQYFPMRIRIRNIFNYSRDCLVLVTLSASSVYAE